MPCLVSEPFDVLGVSEHKLDRVVDGAVRFAPIVGYEEHATAGVDEVGDGVSLERAVDDSSPFRVENRPVVAGRGLPRFEDFDGRILRRDRDVEC